MRTRKWNYGSCWLGWFWDAEEQRRGGSSVRTLEAAQVSQGWLDSWLNIAARTWIKQTCTDCTPSIHYKERWQRFTADLWSGKTIRFHSWGNHLGKFSCMSCKPSDSALIWLKWICLSVGVLDPGRLTRPLLRLGYTGPRSAETVCCQSYPYQECNSIHSKSTAETSEDWWRRVG